jgi:AcrR family transcriptional regulator
MQKHPENTPRRLGRPTAALITRASIVDAALQIVDEDGPEGLNVRKIAKALDVTPASLYHHFANKEEILAELTMHLLRKQRIPKDQAGWQETFVKGTHQYRRTLLEHPRAAPILAARLWQGHSYAKFEHSLSSMAAGGVPENLQLALMRAGEMLGLASALIGPNWDNSKYGDVPEEYPSLRRALKADTWTAEESFDLTIKALVAGFESLVLADESRSSDHVDTEN